MNTNGLSHALLLDKNGGAKSLSYEEIKSYNKTQGLLWVHFDYSSEEAIEWITNVSGIDEVAIDALLTSETRPRTTILDNSILLALRGVNLHPNSDPEDMISIRLFISKDLIVSTKKRDLLSVQDIINSFNKNKGPLDSSEFLIDLTDRLTSRMEGTMNDLEDRASEIEEMVISSNNAQVRTEISRIRREAISLRRYLFPQKEAMHKLYSDKISWISEHDRIQLREITDQLIRYVEELDSINDKVTLIQEEILSKMSEQMNQRMYVLSIISAIFLPLGFLTGLFGINVAGLPGTENKDAFMFFTIALSAMGVGLFYLLKRNKWI
ncbi:zinc transporter ZntB [Arcobacter sp. CECT 8983]|uniref:zinc transporter ZntB n=1 Tax=Arcobacter sp. CECT 8983 TaxID=2044508 RepID=UPI00100C05F0|nr:zinc transporter ZntB [Arcobacter sp. CECT 8983]RXJ90431.1 zinc transporter ZntB [Arcobacter sp. CECT 8983]